MANKIKNIIIIFIFFTCLSCTQKGVHNAAAVRELRIFAWSDYIEPEFVKDFEQKTNSKVLLDYFGSNEELLAKLQVSIEGKSQGYDLVLPSDYMVRNMIKLNLLRPIDKTKLTFLKDFDERFLHPEYDPHLQYCIPMAWGTTGIAINTKLAPDFDFSKGISWKELFEDVKYRGKTTMLDDPKETLHAILLLQGKSWAKASAEDIKRAYGYIKKNKKNLRIFTQETRPVLEADECILCQSYSGDALQTAKKKPEIRYLVPNEGGTIWTDNFAIPKNAKNIELAYAFLNEILSAEGGKRFTEKTLFATPNKKSRALLPAAIASNTTIFPVGEVIKKLHYITEKPELALLMDKEWTEVKSQ